MQTERDSRADKANGIKRTWPPSQWVEIITKATDISPKGGKMNFWNLSGDASEHQGKQNFNKFIERCFSINGGWIHTFLGSQIVNFRSSSSH